MSKVDIVNLVDFIIQFEEGKLDQEDTLELFSYLIKSGQAWQLQGSYGRAAAGLIENGIINKDGSINHDKAEELSNQ